MIIYRYYPENNDQIFHDFSDVFEAYKAYKANEKMGMIYKVYPDNVHVLLYF